MRKEHGASGLVSLRPQMSFVFLLRDQPDMENILLLIRLLSSCCAHSTGRHAAQRLVIICS